MITTFTAILYFYSERRHGYQGYRAATITKRDLTSIDEVYEYLCARSLVKHLVPRATKKLGFAIEFARGDNTWVKNLPADATFTVHTIKLPLPSEVASQK